MPTVCLSGVKLNNTMLLETFCTNHEHYSRKMPLLLVLHLSPTQTYGETFIVLGSCSHELNR